MQEIHQNVRIEKWGDLISSTESWWDFPDYVDLFEYPFCPST